MRALTRRVVVTATAVCLASAAAIVAATPASAAPHCRRVTADSVRFFANSSGTQTTFPHFLFRGDYFRTEGYTNNRYRSTTYEGGPGLYRGWVTTNGAYNEVVPVAYCFA